MDQREQFNKWVEMWEKARAEFEKNPPPKIVQNSFFGFGSSEDHKELNEDDAAHWKKVLDRHQKLFGPELNEHDKIKKPKDEVETEVEPTEGEYADGFGDDLTPPGKGVKFKANPTHFASAGKDQELRVGKFSSGKELKQLNDIRLKIHDFEDELSRQDGLGNSEKADEIYKKIKELKRKADELSDLLVPDPKTDVV